MYREMDDVLGGEERESSAVRDFGAWRDRTRTMFLAGFAIAGIVPAAYGYSWIQTMQFRYNGDMALLFIDVIGAIVPWVIMMLIGRTIGRRVVAQRSDAKVAQLAAAYEIPVERLAAAARLAGGVGSW